MATTEEWECKKHGGHYTKVEAVENGFKCTIVENSKCPECSNLLNIERFTSGQYYLRCHKCGWNSSQNTPSLISPSKEQLAREAIRFGLTKGFKICNKKLKNIQGKEICPKCFLDLLQRDTNTNFSTIEDSFNINTTQMIKLVNKFMDEQRIDGIIDKEHKLFHYIPPEIKNKIISKFKEEGIITILDLATMLDINSKQAHQLILKIINQYQIKGRFSRDLKKYYTNDYLTKDLTNIINQKGRISLADLSKHYYIAQNIIKDICVKLMRSKAVDAYFGDKANQIVTSEQINKEILNYAKQQGVFRLNDLANRLKIALELTRRRINEMIKRKRLKGFFTQKREFMTMEYFEKKLKEFARAYEKVPLQDMAEKLGITMGTVEETLAALISKGEIYGKIDSQNKLLIVKDVPAPIPLAKQINRVSTADDENIEVVREYDFVGGQLHFKVVVRNFSSMTIHNVQILLDPPSSYNIKDPLITVPVIEVGNSRGVDFYLEPKECGISSIGGTVIYKDATGHQHTILIRKKEVQIKCPLVCTDMSTIEDCQLAIQSLPNDARAFLIADLDPRLAYRAAIRTLKHFDTSVVTTYEGGDVKNGEYESEAWFCAEAKVTGGRIITRVYVSSANQSLEVRVWCNNPGQLTGFLAKIIEMLFEEINIIRKIKAEEREKTIDAMAITQNLAEISDYCMLKWKAQNIRLKLHDTFIRLKKILGDNNPMLSRIEFWLTKLNSYAQEANISDKDAEKLGNDVENFKNLLKRSLTL
ncbi:MAG: PCI domain-containing protein [Promethearchaeota archaeon]